MVTTWRVIKKVGNAFVHQTEKACFVRSQVQSIEEWKHISIYSTAIADAIFAKAEKVQHAT